MGIFRVKCYFLHYVRAGLKICCLKQAIHFPKLQLLQVFLYNKGCINRDIVVRDNYEKGQNIKCFFFGKEPNFCQFLLVPQVQFGLCTALLTAVYLSLLKSFTGFAKNVGKQSLTETPRIINLDN